MNRFRPVPVVLLLILSVFAIAEKPLLASDDSRFAQVSLAHVYKSSAKVQAAINEMSKMQAEANPKINALSNETKKIQESLVKGKDKLTPEETEKLEKELGDKMETLKGEQQTLRNVVAARRKTLQDAIKSEIDNIIEKIAKQDGIVAIFMKESLVYSKSLPDITDRVTKALDSLPALDFEKK